MEWRFRHGGREQSVRLASRLIVNQVDAALSAVRDGRGIASDVRLLKEFEGPPLPVQLVVSSARHMPARVRAFLDHVAAELASYGRSGKLRFRPKVHAVFRC
jgi:DNA-binding transcriptional LysR family regulator